MILSYNEAVDMFGSEYKLSCAVAEKEIYKQENGIYSTEEYVPEI